MQELTGAITSTARPVQTVLDLCMAPGGYTATALQFNEDAYACGITLPMSEGGHELVVANEKHCKDRLKEILYQDITMYVPHLDGVPITVPEQHPDAAKFILERPFADQNFDLVFCDGQILRTQELGDHRARGEAERLSLSQLIIAVERVSEGGTIIMLLHNPDRYRSAKLLMLFSSFSKIELFKPETSHRHRGSFYMIARHVQNCKGKERALREWREAWKIWTFNLPEGNFSAIEQEIDDLAGANELINTFGERLLELAPRIWEIQYDALGNKNWARTPENGKSRPLKSDSENIKWGKFSDSEKKWGRMDMSKTPQSENVNPRYRGQSAHESGGMVNRRYRNKDEIPLSSPVSPIYCPPSRRQSVSKGSLLGRNNNNNSAPRPEPIVTQHQPKATHSRYGGQMGHFAMASGDDDDDGGLPAQKRSVQLSDKNDDIWTRGDSTRVPSAFLTKNWRAKTSDETVQQPEKLPHRLKEDMRKGN